MSKTVETCKEKVVEDPLQQMLLSLISSPSPAVLVSLSTESSDERRNVFTMESIVK